MFSHYMTEMNTERTNVAPPVHRKDAPDARGLIAPVRHEDVKNGVKPEVPKPPKKPLTPYMRYSKLTWPEVKKANPDMSVCDVGEIIGKRWRSLSEEEKKPLNDIYLADKVRYDTELKSYLKLTGLHASDLVRKPKKKDL